MLAPMNTMRGALIDPARRERAVLVSLAAYLALWTIYGTIAKSSQGLHPDMTELIAWSRDLAWGYKHPPLAALIVRLWFSLFPVAEWSYYLLAMLMPTLALWIVWRLSADYFDIEKRVVGLALLMLVPFFNFHALKFNVNTVLIPAWAATTLWFLRSYKTRSPVYAALAGVGAAACILGKYWSVFLLAGLVLATLIDKRRAGYFRSAAPWITVAVGLIVIAPHLLWLYRSDFAPFGYAMSVHGDKSFASAAYSVLGYLAGSLGYVAIPVIVVLAAAQPSRATIADMMWPGDTDRRLAAAAFWAPLLLPAAGALASGTAITSLWSMPAWTLLPVLLLSPPAVTLREIDTRRILAAAIAIPLLMVIASPMIAVVAQRNGPNPASAQLDLLAAQVERVWHEITPQPLRYVGGEADLAFGIIAYASERPRALTNMPQPVAAELARSGMVLVCFAEDAGCSSKASAQAATGHRIESEIVRNYLSFAGKPQRYTILIVPPRP
ncbi:MAG TPA: glycosyltransferase family 39 protein [Pseudolabrys sp.]|nr:glycosyltransferase family 39 protein [Pseudolabrys sp.]